MQEADAAAITREVNMLVLSRKVGEKLRIGPDVTVTITKIRGNKIQLAVQAPRDVQIIRDDAVKTKVEIAAA